MDKVKAMQTFVRIVEANSFTKAAETLGLPRAALTATIQKLEAYLGTTLLLRTTRKLSLTTDGAEYYDQCVQILAAIDVAEQGFRGAASATPRGTLRVELPGAVSRVVILPRLGAFLAAWPELALTISVANRFVDLTQEGVDCALRVGALQDSSLIGRQVGSMRFVTCASPAYLAAYGTPHTIADLRSHRGIVHFSGRTGRPFEWDFEVDGRIETAQVPGPVAIDDADANVICALQGIGITQAAAYQVRAHLQSGALVELLPAMPPVPMPVSLLYPKGRVATPKLRVFAEWVAGVLADEPDMRLSERNVGDRHLSQGLRP